MKMMRISLWISIVMMINVMAAYVGIRITCDVRYDSLACQEIRMIESDFRNVKHLTLPW